MNQLALLIKLCCRYKESYGSSYASPKLSLLPYHVLVHAIREDVNTYFQGLRWQLLYLSIAD